MSEPWLYQLRVTLADDAAVLVRSRPDDPVLRPLMEVLKRHHATLVSQFDAFEQYVIAAETEGPEKFPLYAWTKAVLADPDKRAEHGRRFALRVSDEEVYARAVADALEADVRVLVGGGLVMQMSRQDTNPANNLPVPAEYRS